MDAGIPAISDRPTRRDLRLRRRLLVLCASPVVLVVLFVIAWGVLPGPRRCLAPVGSCSGFRSGAVDVFGAGNFTLAQTVLMAVGIWLSAVLLALAAIPARAWLGAGFALLILAAVIARALPSPIVGPEPSVLCFTPGVGGEPVAGRCATGPAPTDSRVESRLLVIGAGITSLGLSGVVDAAARRRAKATTRRPSDPSLR